MAWTKKQYIEQAFEEIGLAGYVFDLSPEQLNSAVKKLDAMVAQWVSNGVKIRWAMPSTPNDSNIDTEVNVADYANEAIYLNLAIRLASSYGKQVPFGVLSLAKQAYNTLLKRSVVLIPTETIYALPVGSGNKQWVRPYLSQPDEGLETNNDNLEL